MRTGVIAIIAIVIIFSLLMPPALATVDRNDSFKLTATNSTGRSTFVRTSYVTVNAAADVENVSVFRDGVFYRNGADAVVYGLSTDTPVIGDWNGNGKDEVGVFRDGVFYRNGADAIMYGLSTDKPVIGDWNGDGISEVGVFRDGVFYRNGCGAIVYGISTDTPVVGDWNGDGASDVGVYRGGVFYRDGADAIVYGLSTDTPVIGKWIIHASGEIIRDTTWSGEVRITGEIRLAKNVTLKIDPGTVVYLSPNSNDQHPPGYDVSDEYTTKYNDPVRLPSWSSNAIAIDCRDGIIEVIGTPENPVIFKPEGSNTSSGQWNGFFIGRGTIQYARLYYAGQTAINVIGNYSGTVEIAHNEVKYTHWAGIGSERNNVWIHDNIIEGGGHQGIGPRYNTLVENNTVSRAQTGIGAENANGAVMRYNTVIDCPVGIGLRSGTSAEVTNNTIMRLNGYPDGWYYQGKLIYPAGAAGWGAILNYLNGTAKIENNTILI